MVSVAQKSRSQPSLTFDVAAQKMMQRPQWGDETRRTRKAETGIREAAAILTAVILRNLAIVLLLAVQHLFIAGSSTIASMAQPSVVLSDPRLLSDPVPQGFWTLSYGIASA